MSDEMAAAHKTDYERKQTLRELAAGLREELAYLHQRAHRGERIGVIQAAINQLEDEQASIVRRWN